MPDGLETVTPKEEAKYVEERAARESEFVKYAKGLQAYLNSLLAAGVIKEERVYDYEEEKYVILTPEQVARRIWEAASEQVSERGITPSLPYYEQVQRGQTYQDVLNEYYRMAATGGIPPRFYSEWNTILADKSLTYDQKKGELLNLIYRSNLREDLSEIYQRKAIDEAFATLPPEEQERLSQIPTATEERARVAAARVPPPEPRYEAIWGGKPTIVGPQHWQRWFENKYTAELERYKATLPAEGIGTEKAELGWAEWLRKREPELREEYAKIYPYGAEGRPWAYQPTIRTVKF